LLVRGGGGQGWGRTADLPLFRDSIALVGQITKGPCCPAQRHLRWSSGTSAIVSTGAGVYRRVPFRLWDSCGDRHQSAKLWGFCGAPGRTQMTRPSRRPDPNPRRRPPGKSVTHRDECQGAILAISPIRCDRECACPEVGRRAEHLLMFRLRRAPRSLGRSASGPRRSHSQRLESARTAGSPR
jgi:hypothetical protein